MVDAFLALAPRAVLTVYSGCIRPPAFAALCDDAGLHLIATIEHEGDGTTFTVERADRPTS